MNPYDKAIYIELKKLAQQYYDVIDKSGLYPGEWSAKQLVCKPGKYRAEAGYWCAPDAEEYAGNVTVKVSNFECVFPWRNIFTIVARWEAEFRPGKNDRIKFAAGDDEIKEVTATINEAGKVKSRKMRLRHVAGCYYLPTGTYKDCEDVLLVAEINGVYFFPGCHFQYWQTTEKRDQVEQFAERYPAKVLAEKLLQASDNDYFAAVAKLAGLEATKKLSDDCKAEAPEAEDTKAPAMNLAGEVRVKVLQYDRDGNTLVYKLRTLKKIREDLYCRYVLDGADVYTEIILHKNGLFWKISKEYDRLTDFSCIPVDAANKWIKNIYAALQTERYINNLQIAVCAKLGYDVTELREAREKYLWRIEEEAIQRQEEEKRAEKEKAEAEQKRKTELTESAKKALLSGEEVTGEQITLLAEALKYTIHGRTLGFIRERVTRVKLNTDTLGVTVWGRKLSQKNVAGTRTTVVELYALLSLEQYEAEIAGAEMPDVADILSGTTQKQAETSQISMQTAKVDNLPAESDNAAKTQILTRGELADTDTVGDVDAGATKPPNREPTSCAGKRVRKHRRRRRAAPYWYRLRERNFGTNINAPPGYLV